MVSVAEVAKVKVMDWWRRCGKAAFFFEIKARNVNAVRKLEAVEYCITITRKMTKYLSHQFSPVF
jgi:hypothetical protein